MTYPLDLLDPQGSGRVISNPVPRAPEGTLREGAASRDFWARGPQAAPQPAQAPTPSASRALVPVDGARMVSGDRMGVPGAPYKPNFTIPAGELPPRAAAAPASLADAAYSAGQKVGAGVNAGKEWLFGAGRGAAPAAAPAVAVEPAKSVLGRAGQAISSGTAKVGSGLRTGAGYVGQAAHALGRAGGVYNTGDSFVQNVEGMSNVFHNDQATLSDKMAAGVEGAGNIIGTGMLNLGNKIPVAGPILSAAIGPNPASRAVDLADASVLDKFNPGKGFGTTRAESYLGATPANAVAPAKPAAPSYQADLRRADVGDTSKIQVATPPDPRVQQGFSETSIPGVLQRGKNEFSDAAGLRDEKFWARGPVSAQNMQAADALAARYGQGGMERQAQYQREVEEANQRNAMGRAIEASERSKLPGGDILSPEFQAQSNRASAERRMMDQLSDPTTGRSVRAALLSRSNAVMDRDQRETESVRGDSTSRRGQDLTYGAATRGQDMNYSSTLRGQDMDLQGRIVPKQMEIQMMQAQRQRLADALNGSRTKGVDGKLGDIDPNAAMQLALQSGDATTAKAIGEWVSTAQGQVKAKNEIEEQNLKRLMRFGTLTNEKGELDEAANRQFMNSVLSQRNDLTSAPDHVLNKEMPGIMAGESVRRKINEARKNQSGLGWTGWAPNINSSDTTAFEGSVPDSFWKKNNQMSTSGWLNGIGGPGELRLSDGWGGEFTLGDNMTSEERAYIADRIEKANKSK